MPDSGPYSIKSKLIKPATADSGFLKIYSIGNQIAGELPSESIVVKRDAAFGGDTTIVVPKYKYEIKRTPLFEQGFDTAAHNLTIDFLPAKYFYNTDMFFELSGVSNLDFKSVKYTNIPAIRKVTEQEIQDNYMQVKLDVTIIIEQEMENLRALKKKNSKPA